MSLKFSVVYFLIKIDRKFETVKNRLNLFEKIMDSTEKDEKNKGKINYLSFFDRNSAFKIKTLF